MREIKFRGKIVEPECKGEWAVGSLIVHDDDGGFVTIYENGSEYEVDPETVGQLTGLTDKNGNEIWEGDILSCQSIVKYGTYCDDEDDGGNDIENVGFYVEHMGALERILLRQDIMHWAKDREVAGNIHDDPDWYSNFMANLDRNKETEGETRDAN